MTKITIPRRKADRKQLRVLAAKHTASLQFCVQFGGSQARLDARSEFEISRRSSKGGGEAGRCSVPTLIHTHEMFAKIWGLREAGNPDSFYSSSERKADPGPSPGTLAR